MEKGIALWTKGLDSFHHFTIWFREKSLEFTHIVEYWIEHAYENFPYHHDLFYTHQLA